MKYIEKDKELEQIFDDYRDSAYSVSPDILDKANEYAKARSKKQKIIKRTVISSFATLAACLLIVVCLNFIGIFSLSQSDKNLSENNGGGTSSELARPFYTLDNLSESTIGINDLPPTMNFVANLNMLNNFSVTNMQAYSQDEEILLIKTDISAVLNGKRQDVVFYAEYSDKTYENLSDFVGSGAVEEIYRGRIIRRSISQDNGEPVVNLMFDDAGVKYYFSVKSSDSEAYKVYLKFILN